MKKNLLTLLAALPLWAAAQNITDLAVASDRTADGHLVQSDLSTVDDTVFLHPGRIRFDHRCLQIEGHDVFLLSGAMHYFRVPQPLWRDRLLKLKQGGFNCVETYVPWNWHEREMPSSPADESKLDLTELEEFLRQAEELGLYVIVRPGPYICAEWSGGGFPQWLMRKRPARTKHEVWLQSDDPAFMEWNEHWYRAVCRATAPHQLHRRAPGTGGIILFQIENEYNRVKWFPAEAKRGYLEELARIARRNGIEVPLITCWTSEARNVTEGPLNGVLDMVNSYPRWEIEKNFGRLINRQLRTQSGKPLLSGELQGGWYSDVAGKLSREQDGVEAVQTQNITLYALQRGFCGISFYMAVGGTNFDDRASRQVTATYDFGAAIGENGSVGERYYRLQSLSDFLMEHGTRVARATEVSVPYRSTDPDVRLCLRQTPEGDRYYFVRTEEHTRHHSGTMLTPDLAFDFALEPFGSMVYYVKAGQQQGEWFPRPMEPRSRPVVKADTLHPERTERFADALPAHWKRLPAGKSLDQMGIYDRHFIYLRTFAPGGELLEVGRIGRRVVNGTDADTLLVSVGGKLIPPAEETDTSATYRIPQGTAQGKKQEVILLMESKGLHHHTNRAVEAHWGIGPEYVRCNGKDLPLEYACTERSRGIALSAGTAETKGAAQEGPLLTWHCFTFTLSGQEKGITCPHHLRLEHTGNGFLYLNGHCIGRCWQSGPQREYYLPECWLRYGGENRIAVSLRPTPEGAEVTRAEIIPETWAAEKRDGHPQP